MCAHNHNSRFSRDYDLANLHWERYSIELDTFARFFMANLPLGQDVGVPHWPKLKRALAKMSQEAFFGLCGDVRDEMYRRNNNLRDGVFALPYSAKSLGQNHIRRKLGCLSDQIFHEFCVQLAFEISRRSSRTRMVKEIPTGIMIDDHITPIWELSSETSDRARLLADNHHHSLRSEIKSPRYLARLLDNLSDLGDEFPPDHGVEEWHPFLASRDYFDETMSTIHSIFVSLLQDKERCDNLLTYRKEAAQQILDLLQMLLDYPNTDRKFKNSLLLALTRLSGKSGLQPRCFILNGVKHGKAPVTCGHFADIWKGDLHGRLVCLKIIKTYQNSGKEFLEAFSREAILWGHISHPNLLPFYGVYHLGDKNGRICLVSPWMRHGNINEYLEKAPHASRSRLVSDVAKGLLYLHERGVVHGDLKGANILVNNYGRACLTDFGLSTILNTMLTPPESDGESNSVAGTIRWQAPELLDPLIDHPVGSIKTDVYAFGCVCYEIYTGRIPFYQYTLDFTVIHQIIKGKKPSLPTSPESPEFRKNGLTQAMCALMEACWEKDPCRRPTMKQIVLNLPLNGIADLWPVDSWEDQESVSRFRNAVYRNDCLSTSVLETVLSWI